MRAITGAVVSSEPCTLVEAHEFLKKCCRFPDSHLTSSDCATFTLTLDHAIVDQHRFLRHCARRVRQQGAADIDAGGYEVQVVEGDERELQGEEKNRGTLVPLGRPHGSVVEEEVAVAADEKKSKKRKMEEDTRDDKAVAAVAPRAPASPEIQFEQRKKRKEKHSSKELVSVVKQEPDLVVEEDGRSERKKKKEKHSDKQLAIVVKQEPGSVPDELGSEKKKGKKKKEKGHVKLEEDLVEVSGQIVSNGVADQGIADGERKRKKKKHSEEVGGSKGVKQEEKMATDSNLDSEKKKKKKKRGRGDDDVQEQGEYLKKQRKES